MPRWRASSSPCSRCTPWIGSVNRRAHGQPPVTCDDRWGCEVHDGDTHEGSSGRVEWLGGVRRAVQGRRLDAGGAAAALVYPPAATRSLLGMAGGENWAERP